MSKIDILIRNPKKDDGKKIYKLVENSKVLDLNSEYLYLLQSTHFENTCSVAQSGDEIIGFVSGYRLPQKPNTLFIWQVAVDERYRGNNLAKRLLMNIIKRKENLDLQFINTTVSPSNNSSIRVFEKLTEELKTKIINKSFFEKEDFNNSHEEEVLYEIGPFKLKEK
ncbi:MAG: diaminobutyrate acetyltransferase [Halarcobacter sp.]